MRNTAAAIPLYSVLLLDLAAYRLQNMYVHAWTMQIQWLQSEDLAMLTTLSSAGRAYNHPHLA